jgi:sugar lactone lactonase YvrE
MACRIGIGAFVLMSTVLTACSSPVLLSELGNREKVWPEPPNQPRIEFVKAFSTLADLGASGSAWSRLANFLAGSKVNKMVRPMSVAVGAEENMIFVADPDIHCVHQYDLEKGGYRCLTVRSGADLLSPMGLAIDSEGTLFVSDSQQGIIYTMEPGGKWLKTLPLKVELQRPTGLFWDAISDNLIIVDTGLQSIMSVTREGALVGTIGGRGSSPGQLNYPTYTWKDSNGDLLVSDSLNFRVQRFDDEGEFLSSFGVVGDSAGDFGRPKGVAVDTLGHIYVVDALFHSLQIFDSSGQLLLAIGGQGHEAGQFWLPNGIFITASNTIFIADSYNRRVQIMRYVRPGQ